MPSAFDPWGPLPSIQDVERALECLTHDYMGGNHMSDYYREKYGDEPNFAVHEPDGGLLASLTFLKRALSLLDVQAAEKRRGVQS